MNHEPAFPRDNFDGVIGMSLRDYFAIRCLAALINTNTYSSSQSTQRDQAKRAYDYADALLEVRGR